MRLGAAFVLTCGAMVCAAEPLAAQLSLGLSPANTVDPKPPAIAQSTAGQTTSFGVQFFAPTAGTDQKVKFTCASSPNITVTSCQALNLTLTSGDPATTITVTYTSGAVGAGWITLTAAQALAAPPPVTPATGRRDFNVVARAATLSPSTSTVYRGVGASGNESFVLTNSGQLATTYSVAYVTSNCAGVVTSCVASPTTVSGLAPGGTQPIAFTYTAASAGVQSISIEASSGGSTLAASSLTVNVISAAISPSSASIPVTSSAISQSYGSFNLVNAPGSPPMTVQLNASCTGVLTSCTFDNLVASKVISLGAGGTASVPVNFIASSTGPGSFVITASSNGVPLGGATLTVTAQAPPVVVVLEPPNPTASWTAGPTPRAYTLFKLTNDVGSPAATIQMDLTCAVVSACQFASNGLSTITVPLNANQVYPFDVTYVAAVAGAGTMRLDAKVPGGSVIATRTLNVAVQGAPNANFTPLTASFNVTTSASVQTYGGFTLTNAAGSPATPIVLTIPTCTAVLTSCVFTDGSTSLSYPLAVNEPLVVPVKFVAASAGSGQVTIRASTGGTQLSQATLTVTADAPISAAFTPASQSVTVTASATQQTGSSFVLTNGAGSPAVTVTLDIPTCSGVLTACLFLSGSGTSTVNLAASGGTQTVGVKYVAQTAGSGTLLVRAMSGTTQLATAALNVNAQTTMATLLPASPSITVTTGAALQGYTNFVLTNAPNSPASTFNLTLTCTLVTSCQFSNGLNAISYSLLVSGNQSVPVNFVAASVGSGTVTVNVASGGVNLTSAVLNITAQAPASVVANLSPPTAAFTVTTGATKQTYSSFTLTNAVGSPPATVDLAFTSCTVVASCQFSNGLATISTNLTANGTYVVPVSFFAATAGTGTVTVRAANGATTLSTATLTVTAQAGGNSMIVATQGLTTDSLLYRDECVSLSLGSAIASECGDLRVVHALPAVRTMGVTRAPLLMYSSGLARYHDSPRGPHSPSVAYANRSGHGHAESWQRGVR